MKYISLFFLSTFLLTCNFFEEIDYRIHMDPGFFPGQPVILEYDYTPGYNIFLFLEVSSYEGPDNHSSQHYGWFAPPPGLDMEMDIRGELERSLPPGDYRIEAREVLSKGGRTTPLFEGYESKETLYFRIDDFATLSGTTPAVVGIFNRVDELGYPEGMKYADVLFGGYEQNGILSGLQYFYFAGPAPLPDVVPNLASASFSRDGFVEYGPGSFGQLLKIMGASPPNPSTGNREFTNQLTLDLGTFDMNDLAGFDLLKPNGDPLTVTEINFNNEFEYRIEETNGRILPSTVVTFEIWDTAPAPGVRIGDPILSKDFEVYFDSMANLFKIRGRGLFSPLGGTLQYKVFISNPSDDPEANKTEVLSFP
jgi:hypothetical protein